MSCGINTRNIASGCIKQIAQIFLILTPSVVVKIPILKLANKNIPNVIKNNDASFDKTKLASNPINRVAIHNKFEKSDTWSDLEYSFFFVNLVSSNCVIAKTPTTSGILNQKSSEPRYPKYVVTVITVATINEAIKEK